MKNNITFVDVCCAVAAMATPDHDLMVIEPTNAATRFTCSSRGLGRSAVEVSEIPASLAAIGIDVQAALEIEGWSVVKTRRGFTATRRASAMSLVREAA